MMATHVMDTFDLYTQPLTGVRLIEASAGTGKTWSIAGLYVRLLLETDATVEKILVVTFTKAATAELRDRLRARLSEVKASLLEGASNDPFCQKILEKFTGEEREKAIKRLNDAIQVFDQSAIYTIHGFCQRVLGEIQSPDFLLEPEVVPDDKEWLPNLINEAWIRHCQHEELAGLILASGMEIDVAREDINAIIKKSNLIIAPEKIEVTMESFLKAKAALQEKWIDGNQTIRDDLNNADGLSRAKDTYKDSEGMLSALGGWLANELAFNNIIRKLTPSEFEVKRKKSGNLPVHSFWDGLADLLTQIDRLVIQFRKNIINDVKISLERQKTQQGVVSFQDLLKKVDEAIRDERVAESVRQQYSAALIDEFQDTDPLQYSIFSTIFSPVVNENTVNDAPLYLVGDPKQAIYSFRGADIYTYQQAKNITSGRYTLPTNWRSSPALVAGVNAIFLNQKNPFLSDIGFPDVNAASNEAVIEPQQNPLQIALLPSSGETDKDGKVKALGKGVARSMATKHTVARIKDALGLNASQTGTKINGKPVKPGDIAVLVAKHSEGRMIASALDEAGIASVLRSQNSVYATQEGKDFLAILEAILAPGREPLVKAALLTSLWGQTINGVYEAQEDEAKWSSVITSLLASRDSWLKEGFMPMWQAWFKQADIMSRLLRESEGERRLTNLRHLGELMQQQADIDPVPERQLAWLRIQVRDAESTEESQLRLESDAERVQILTIHVSKGLEYPLVFLPFLFDGGLIQKQEKHRAEYHAGKDVLLDLGSERVDHAQKRMATERLSEKIRLLYVALTRAKYSCHVTWGYVTESEQAAFSWLMLGGETEGDPDYANVTKLLSQKTYADYVAALEHIQKIVPDSVHWQVIDESACQSVKDFSLESPPVFEPIIPAFNRMLRAQWSISSFTGLTHHKEHESPDHDNEGNTPASLPATVSESLKEIEPKSDSIHAFPRGAKVGEFWHSLFEDIVSGKKSGEQQIKAAMAKYAIEESWFPIAAQEFQQLLDTPLGEEGATLRSLQSARAEMEFMFPVAGFSRESLQKLPDVPEPFRKAMKTLGFYPLTGFLKGFIDLIYQHNGKYYVLDYKTNWLGPDDSFYTTNHMQEAIADAQYYLQYWLYTLALHRYLKKVLKGYDYDTHFGGVRYFFIRGYQAEGQGVFQDRPSRALINALDGLMNTAEKGVLA